MLQKLSDSLLCSIDVGTGQVLPNRQNEILSSINIIESICDILLGSKLLVRGKVYKLIGLEIYYAGIGDKVQDWYKIHFGVARGVNGAHVHLQKDAGLRVYFNQNPAGQFSRMDITVGPDETPASILIRDIYDMANQQTVNGWHNCIVHMGIQQGDLGSQISINGNVGHFLIDPDYDVNQKNIEANLRVPFIDADPALQNNFIDAVYGLKWYRKLL